MKAESSLLVSVLYATNCSTVTDLYYECMNAVGRIFIHLDSTYYESHVSPLISQDLILKEIVSTAGHTIDSIVAAHDTSHPSLLRTRLKGWEVSLQIMIKGFNFLEYYNTNFKCELHLNEILVSYNCIKVVSVCSIPILQICICNDLGTNVCGFVSCTRVVFRATFTGPCVALTME